MPRPRSATLTDAELRLMTVLWQQGGATVEEVIAHLPKAARRAHNTVLTLLRILEAKGYVRHRRERRAFRFLPLVDREAARHSAVRYLLNRFFDGSAGLLVQNLLEHESLGPDEIKRLRALVRE